ncbi:MAG: twitching motility protein PilT [Candidatus Bathyarchaeota archaeon B24]|nr:MAG: twitching motility protein PilT [Candidatus Bathyarchaeota archaeon B24]RLI24181.1 MAG: PIN domain nuclease [Candidatus Bathyarchaeota archaeon]
MTVAYLDSSAIVKRYILEAGSEVIGRLYHKVLSGESVLALSAWNIGEVFGVFAKYLRKGWLSEEEYERARYQFIGEVVRLLRLKLLKIVPVKTRLLIRSWSIIEKYHIYEADALQIVSAKYVKADLMYTGDRRLHEIAVKEGVKSLYLH